MRFVVFSRAEVEKTPVAGRVAYISLNDSDQTPANLPIGEGFVDVLRLSFDDVLDDADQGRPIIVFNDDHARQILDFWNRVRNQIETLVVHCNGGQCRSPGVAAALQRIETGDDERWFRTKRPNVRVYRRILEVYHEGLDAEPQG